MSSLCNKPYLCTLDYHSKFLIIRKTEDFSVDNLILACTVTFAEYGLPKKIIIDLSNNFVLEKIEKNAAET